MSLDVTSFLAYAYAYVLSCYFLHVMSYHVMSMSLHIMSLHAIFLQVMSVQVLACHELVVPSSNQWQFPRPIVDSRPSSKPEKKNNAIWLSALVERVGLHLSM